MTVIIITAIGIFYNLLYMMHCVNERNFKAAAGIAVAISLMAAGGAAFVLGAGL